MNYADQVNLNKYRNGGTITGQYDFAADVNMTGSTAVKLAQNTAKLVDSSDAGNNVRFTVDYVEVSKGLNVVGPLVAPNLANQAVYPVDIVCDSIVCSGDIQGSTKVAVPSVEATTAIKTPKWTGTLSGQPDYDAMEYKTNEILVGGGTLNGNAMPEMKLSNSEAHITHTGSNGIFVGPIDTRVKQGNTETIYADDEKITNLDNYSEAVSSVFTPADPNAGLGALITIAKHVMPFFTPSGSHPELRRRMASDYHFIDDTGAMESYAVKPQSAQTVHLTNAQLDVTDANSLVNKTAHALQTALRDTRNPRTIIAGTRAEFGLHQDYDDTNDAVPVHLLMTQPSAVDASYLQTQVDKQILKCTNKSGVAFEVAYKGYDSNDALTNEGTRVAVSGQDEVGKVYLGKFDNGLPADSSAESAFSHVNIQGSVRFSGVPSGSDVSGDIVAEVTPTGIKTDDIRPQGAQLDFNGAIDFSNATVTGIPGVTGLLNAVDTTSPVGVAITGQLDIGTPTSGNHQVYITGDNMYTNTVGQSDIHWNFLQDSTDVHCNLRFDGAPKLFTHMDLNTLETDMTSNIHTVTFNGNHNITGPTPPGYPGTYTASEYIPLKVKWSDYSNSVNEPNPVIATFSTTGIGTIFTVSGEEVESTVKVIAPNIDSSGNFTACHAVEPVSQTIANCVGKIVKSSGSFCVRGNDGVKYTLPKNAPTLAHAMCSVSLCDTDDDPAFLGVVSTVETVLNEKIYHQHGGVTIRSKYAGEADGYKVLRVAASGDAMVLLCGDGTSGQNPSVGSLLCSSDIKKNYGNVTTYLFDGATQGSNNTHTLTLYTNATTGQEFLRQGATGSYGYQLESDGTPGDRYQNVAGTPALFATRDSFAVNGSTFTWYGTKPSGAGWNTTFTNWDVVHDFNNTTMTGVIPSHSGITLLEVTGGDGMQYYKYSTMAYGFRKTANGTPGALYVNVNVSAPVIHEDFSSWTPSTNRWIGANGTEKEITGWSATNPDWHGGFAQVQSGTAKKSHTVG